MPVSDRAQLDDLSFQEFDPIFRLEDADLCHSVILVDCKQPSGDFDLHAVRLHMRESITLEIKHAPDYPA